VQVDRDVLYVDEGSVLTGAVTAAGIDLALHVVRSEHGACVANELARRMVGPPQRDVGQRNTSAARWKRSAGRVDPPTRGSARPSRGRAPTLSSGDDLGAGDRRPPLTPSLWN